MYQPIRIFGLLLYKSWLVRKRAWIGTLIGEFVLPVGFVILAWALMTSEEHNKPPKEIKTDIYYEPESWQELIARVPDLQFDDTYISYAPDNTFTNELMNNVVECFDRKIKPKCFATENDFYADYNRHPWHHEIAVIFNKYSDDSVKRLRYKIQEQATTMGATWNLYNDKAAMWDMTDYYTKRSIITQLQICVDSSFISMKAGKKPPFDMYIQRVPYPAHIDWIPYDDKHSKTFRNVVISALMFPLVLETAKATNEKFVGVNVLMSMNGISNTLNLLSWLISGFLLLTFTCAIPILILFITSPSRALCFLCYGNPLLLFFILIFYIGHLLAFGIHISAYFSKALLVITVLLCSNVFAFILRSFAFTEKTVYIAPYIGVLFPITLFMEATDEIRNYERTGEGIQWYNLFQNADPDLKIGGSIGMILIFSSVGIIFHFLLAIYIYAVNPGKYGAAKHPLYFLKSKKKYIDERAENLNYDETNDKYFEAIPAGVYDPGIQIRNLEKAYKINPFSKHRVRALRGVSVDFYKGQITSLLGHNGAGKTTMLSILTGMISPTNGLIMIDGKNLKTDASEIMTDMGLCTQENMYFASLTVSEQLWLFAMVKRKGISSSLAHEDVEALLHDLSLFEKKNNLPHTLSGGQKRRLCLGMALVSDSSTLILDEPTSGLDPESRRVIWNKLLKMRGQKTILISTHDMEEADILGDRIAIMHTGQLKSYGTSLFLKRLIGQNNVEITLSIDARSDPDKIRKELHSNAIIAKREPSKMIVKIPNSPSLPDILDNMEKKKKELGVSGFSVSLISLEQVFLKMTQENYVSTRTSQVEEDEEEGKLKGKALYLQTLRGLLLKKLTYVAKDYATMLVKILTICMALVLDFIVLKGLTLLYGYENKLVAVKLNMYHRPDVLYTSYDENLSNRYRAIVRKFHGNPIKVTDTNLDTALLQRARDNIAMYDNYMIAATEFNESSINAFYSHMATYSLPISINLLWNAILQDMMGPEYSISLFHGELPHQMFKWQDLTDVIGYTEAMVLVMALCLTVAMFVIHPNREAARGVKQLQKMTGVNGLNYWGTIFLLDLIEFAFFVVVLIAGFVVNNYFLELQLYGPEEILMEMMLLMMFGVNILPFIYIFSFLKKKTSSVVRLALFIPAAFVAIDLIIHVLWVELQEETFLKGFRKFQRRIFLLVPCVSFSESQISYFLTTHANARCRRLPNAYYMDWCNNPSYTNICCDSECWDGKCNKSKKYFDDPDLDITLTECVAYLCWTPILYFGILALIESEIIQKLVNARGKRDIVEPSSDEQVQLEKDRVYERIQTLKGNRLSAIDDGVANEGQVIQSKALDNQMFLVYELRKSYKKFKAVKGISFGVYRRECFGLLGVNGAGKSTTFRMMTGATIRDHGIMYLEDKRSKKHTKHFLSQLGYVPQHDAIMKRLNTYDHLRLFARLRGIPEKEVKNEVLTWIERLNLEPYASQPCGTYSGGNKRRLNIGMALIGNPSLVLMDEPTTGVDPGARRSLWNVIKDCQMAGQAVILTSHSMDECETLCNRLAIMVSGKLVCIGPSEQLKQRFGAGYDIQIRMDPQKAKSQLDSIKSEMPRMLRCVVTDENLGYLMYHVSPAGTTWRKMYDVMNAMKKKYDCIDDFLILSASLEQLFLMFARSANGNSSTEPTDENTNQSI